LSNGNSITLASFGVVEKIMVIAQAFFYNAIFFTYALLLVNFYKIPPERVGYYLLPFAVGNLAGPLVLGKLFDTVGRKPMIITTYGGAGILLAATGWMF
jgi:MFS family permease